MREKQRRAGDEGPGRRVGGPSSWLLAPCSKPVGFDDYSRRGGVAKRYTTAVYHANKGSVAAYLGHESAFAKAHFPNTLAESRLAGEGAHATRAAGGKLAERQGLGTKAIKGGWHDEKARMRLRLSLTVNVASGGAVLMA